jgi:hypothetical protein
MSYQQSISVSLPRPANGCFLAAFFRVEFPELGRQEPAGRPPASNAYSRPEAAGRERQVSGIQSGIDLLSGGLLVIVARKRFPARKSRGYLAWQVRLEEVNERTECDGRVAMTGVIQKKPGNLHAPCL